MRSSKSRRGRRGSRSLDQEQSSPHELSLLGLAKNPDRIKGRHEHYSQVRVMDWLYRNMRYVYDHTHATPNGGARSKATASALQAEGLKKGYPDLSIDLARGGYHGMRIEMKYGSNRLTTEQVEWMVRLSEAGYYCLEARSFDEAISAIKGYVGLDDFDYGDRA